MTNTKNRTTKRRRRADDTYAVICQKSDGGLEAHLLGCLLSQGLSECDCNPKACLWLREAQATNKWLRENPRYIQWD